MKNLLLLLLIMIVFPACQSKPSENATDTTTAKHEKNSGLHLNEGAKWEANPETTQGINTMIRHVETFKQVGSTDYLGLKSTLDADFKMIFQKCTMKGEAHDQLHAYLMPLKTELDKLSEANIDSVSRYLQRYSVYFE